MINDYTVFDSDKINNSNNNDKLNNIPEIPQTDNTGFQNLNSSDYYRGMSNNPNKKDKKKKKRGPVFWLALIVLIASLIGLGVIVWGYLQGRMLYNDISDTAFKDTKGQTLADMTVDWDALRAINPDIVAWVYMPGTAINYPVVQTTNNETYLVKPFRGWSSYIHYGCIFMDYNDKPDFTSQNIITYGHHMNDGTMYALIGDMKDTDVFNQHREIFFLTPYGNFRLTTFTEVRVAATEKIVQTEFSTPGKMTEYIQDKINRSIVTPNTPIPDPAEMSKIFMFSTCDNIHNDHRYICYAYVAETTYPGCKALG